MAKDKYYSLLNQMEENYRKNQKNQRRRKY